MRSPLTSHLARPVALAATVVLLAACADGSGPTAPQLRPNEPLFDRVIFEGEDVLHVTNEVVDCDGTLIDVTGNGTISFVLKEDGSGGLHFTAKIQQSLTGVGVPSLVTFSGSTTATETFNVPGLTFEITMVSKGNLKADDELLSESLNFSFHETFHLTMNANGTITATAFNSFCK